jgi:hypothetical protein
MIWVRLIQSFTNLSRIKSKKFVFNVIIMYYYEAIAYLQRTPDAIFSVIYCFIVFYMIT